MKTSMLKRLTATLLAASVVAAMPLTASAAWKNTDGVWQWTENGGYATGWRWVNGAWYHFNASGDMTTGWHQEDGKWYFLKESGAMAQGWVQTGEKWYCMKPNGEMRTGWVKTKDNWYYLAPAGDMATGVVQINDKVYALSETGAMQTGKVEIGGKTFTFDESGAAVGSAPAPERTFTVTQAPDGALIAAETTKKDANGQTVLPTPEKKPSTGGGGGGSVTPTPPVDTSTHVTTAGELTAALADSSVSVITVDGTIGQQSDNINDYAVFTVDRTVTIKGGTNAEIYGSFIVKAENVTISGLHIYNGGNQNMTDYADVQKNAVNVAADSITLTNNTFDATAPANAAYMGNGVVIFASSATGTNYQISGNTFKGYKTSESGYSSTGLLISAMSSYKSFFGKDGSTVLPQLTDDEDYALITGNTYTDCKNDYVRSSYLTGANVISCTSNSSTDNFRLSYAGSGAKFYVTGNVTRESDTEIKANSELIVDDGCTLTVAEDATLTVKGTLTVDNGKLAGPGLLKVEKDATVEGLAEVEGPGLYFYDGTAKTWKSVATITVGDIPRVTEGTVATPSGDKGAITGFTPGANNPTVGITLRKASDVLTENIRVRVSGLDENAGVQLIAKDTSNDTYWDIVIAGWGDPTNGFPCPATETTTTVYPVATTAGEYTAVIEVYTVSDNKVVASKAVTFTVDSATGTAALEESTAAPETAPTGEENPSEAE